MKSLAEQLQTWQQATPEWKRPNRHERRKAQALARIRQQAEAEKKLEAAHGC